MESEADIHQALYWPQYVKKNCKECKLVLSTVAKGYLPWRERAMRDLLKLVCIARELLGVGFRSYDISKKGV